MSKNNTWLYEHKRNVFSQGGEDGVIEKILELLPQKDNWCVEFGALDGRDMSNTCHLIENAQYRAVLIEAVEKHYQKLESAHGKNTNVLTFNRFVGFGPEDNLDSILRETPIPTQFDLLSIDIDGNDYHVWQACTQYQPKVVVIEFNPTIPEAIDYVQAADPEVSKGSSLRSIVALGKQKGYELVCVVNVNAIFVRAEYFPLFEITDNSISQLWLDQSNVTHLFVTYDGEICLVGNKTLKWHRIPIDPGRIQQLPRFLRRFPGNYTPVQQLLFGLFLLVKNPREFGRQFRRKVLGQR